LTDHSKKSVVYSSNVKLHESELVIQNFGNVSGRLDGSILIKPSGVDIHKINYDDIVTVQINNNKFSGNLKPSSDTPTHLELYKTFPMIGGICHTHSTYASAWAQSGKPIPCFGTTHADYWNGEIPVSRKLTDEEIKADYEKETGKVIIEKINELNVDPLDCPGILVAGHGPFTWGSTAEDAVKHAELLEYIAKLAWMTISINPETTTLSSELLKKHFSRKHGPQSYYGQGSD